MGSISVIMLFCLLIAFVLIVLKQAHITMRKKLITGSVLMLMLGVTGWHNYTQSKRANVATLLEQAFNEEKTLNCEGFLVHKNDFNLITQTYTLIGKSNTPTSNIIITLEKCVITEPQTQEEELPNGHTIEELGRE